MIESTTYPIGYSFMRLLSRRLPTSITLFIFLTYSFAAQRLSRQRYVVKTYFNQRLYCNLQDFIQRRIVYFGVWEPNVSKVIEGILRPGDTFVDVGANIGYDTLLASTRVGGAGTVVAIEASPSTYSSLLENLRLNEAKNVRAVNCAAADTDSDLILFEGPNSNTGAATTKPGRFAGLQTTVRAKPLNSILSTEELSRVALIKIDVEGGEAVIIKHLIEHLEDFPAGVNILVEVSPNDNLELWPTLFEKILAAGYLAYSIENEYSYQFYLRATELPKLRRVTHLPLQQTDILFTTENTRPKAFGMLD